ncbi:hypothetical protein CYMTET_32963 [Cymbomonas tetramitiformis]|uniref:Cyclic nucleotide-binding domain-containing protein n=1 Tax=Cymbomonas tetramitiformis TaxID=36881 RepID=A0AAE0FEM3_9CHLO|nr:hypothetical protein CYMTET_32963 [Cymbomonas tetramitiformis]
MVNFWSNGHLLLYFHAWKHYVIHKRESDAKQNNVNRWIKVLMTEPSERSTLQVNTLLELVADIAFFKDLSADLTFHICRLMRWCTKVEGDVLFHKGAIGDLYYIVIYGMVLITSATPDENNEYPDFEEMCQDHKLLANLHSGDAFGELALMDPRGLRTASAVVAQRTGLVTLCKDDYQQLVLKFREEQARDKVDFLCRLPMFGDCSVQSLRNWSFGLFPQRFPAGETVVHEDEVCSSIYFIVTGLVNLYRGVRVGPVAGTAEVQQVMLFTLNPGELFAHFGTKGTKPALSNLSTARQPCTATVRLDTECLVGKKSTLLSTLDAPTLKRFLALTTQFPDDSVIQDALTDEVRWLKHKRGLISESVPGSAMRTPPFASSRPQKQSKADIQPIDRPGVVTLPFGSDEHFLSSQAFVRHDVDFIGNAAIMAGCWDSVENGSFLHTGLLDRLYQTWVTVSYSHKVRCMRFSSCCFLAMIVSTSTLLQAPLGRLPQVDKLHPRSPASPTPHSTLASTRELSSDLRGFGKGRAASTQPPPPPPALSSVEIGADCTSSPAALAMETLASMCVEVKTQISTQIQRAKIAAEQEGNTPRMSRPDPEAATPRHSRPEAPGLTPRSAKVRPPHSEGAASASPTLYIEGAASAPPTLHTWPIPPGGGAQGNAGENIGSSNGDALVDTATPRGSGGPASQSSSPRKAPMEMWERNSGVSTWRSKL